MDWNVHQASYWELDALDNHYDYVIVGAGLVGCSTALFLAKHQPDARILILERGWWPAGASTRNAGFGCFGSITELLADLEKEEETVVRQRVQGRFEGLNLLRSTLGDEALQLEECGGYELFVDQSNFERAADHIPRFNEWMRELLGEKDVYVAEHQNGYPVIANRLETALHPGRMVRELLRKVQQQGVSLRFGVEVESIEAVGIFLKDGPMIRADHTVVCANGFVRKLLPELPVTPGRGYVFVTKPLKKLAWKGTYHYDEGFVYFRHLGSDRLLLGGARNMDQEAETTSEFGVNDTIKHHLVSFASDVLKLSEGWEIDYEWSGIMGFTPSKSAFYRTLHPGLTVAAGLSGMGVALGMRLGQQVAEDLSAN
jgi:gamma-glutamylputrescine oxidase